MNLIDNFRVAPTPHRSAVRGRRVMDAGPVQLLRDQRGVYGIGVAEEYDIEALASACNVVDAGGVCVQRSLILRPDQIKDALPWWERPRRAALQKIVGGLRRGIFNNTTEEGFRQIIHHEALKSAGLPWPPYEHEPDLRWWSRDKLRQAENRRMYHGLRLFSLFAINRLIGQLIEDAADRDAIRAARRFALPYREDIYRAATSHPRVLQLADTFPVAALAACADFTCNYSPDLSGPGSVGGGV